MEIPSLNDAELSKTQILSAEESVEFLGMELFYKEKAGLYGKKIRHKVRKRIAKDFEEESTFKYAIENGKTFAALFQRLNSKIKSYEATYEGAENLDALLEKIHKIKTEGQRKILVDIFGEDALDNVSKEQKLFLGLEV